MHFDHTLITQERSAIGARDVRVIATLTFFVLPLYSATRRASSRFLKFGHPFQDLAITHLHRIGFIQQQDLKLFTIETKLYHNALAFRIAHIDLRTEITACHLSVITTWIAWTIHNDMAAKMTGGDDKTDKIRTIFIDGIDDRCTCTTDCCDQYAFHN